MYNCVCAREQQIALVGVCSKLQSYFSVQIQSENANTGQYNKIRMVCG